MSKKTLLQKTMELAHELDPHVPDIVRDTGLKDRWIRRFLDGDYKNPGVNFVEKVHDYLVALKAKRRKSKAA